jgi:hypothetical protein
MAERQGRRVLGPCNILTVREAVQELAMRHSVARAWMDAHGLIHLVAGRRRVIAGELAEAVRMEGADRQERPSRRWNLRRVHL